MSTDTTRRALLGGAGITAVLAAAPIAATGAPLPQGSPAFRVAMNATKAADHRFNNLPGDLELTNPALHAAEEDRLHVAFRAAKRAVPTTWAEYVELFDCMTDNGMCALDEDDVPLMRAHAKRLLASGLAA